MQRISTQVSCAGYDTIIIGASVYIGMLNKEVKEFVTNQRDILKTCRVCMFTLGLQQEDTKKVIVENLGNQFYESLFYYDAFGGRITMKSLSFMERNIIRVVNKKMKLIDSLNNDSVMDTIDETRVKTFDTT